MIAVPASILCDIGVCSATQDVVKSAFGVVASAFSDGARWAIRGLVHLLSSSTEPRMSASWFSGPAARMETVAALVTLPVLLVATIGAVLRQDGRRLARVWAVGLPVAVLSAVVLPGLADSAIGVTEELCGVVAGPGYKAIVGPLGRDVTSAFAGLPVLVTVVLAGLGMLGALLIWLELSLRMAAVYVTVLFMPVVLVSYVWPATAGMTRRAVELLAALVLSKFVIVGCLVVGLSALSQRAVSGAVAGTGILLLAGFAPFSLLRLVPVVETAAIAHLEGLARRPVHAAARVAGTAGSATGHPVAQLLIAGAGEQEPDARPVAPQPIPEHRADFPVAGPGACAGDA